MVFFFVHFECVLTEVMPCKIFRQLRRAHHLLARLLDLNRNHRDTRLVLAGQRFSRIACDSPDAISWGLPRCLAAAHVPLQATEVEAALRSGFPVRA